MNPYRPPTEDLIDDQSDDWLSPLAQVLLIPVVLFGGVAALLAAAVSIGITISAFTSSL